MGMDTSSKIIDGATMLYVAAIAIDAQA